MKFLGGSFLALLVLLPAAARADVISQIPPASINGQPITPTTVGINGQTSTSSPLVINTAITDATQAQVQVTTNSAIVVSTQTGFKQSYKLILGMTDASNPSQLPNGEMIWISSTMAPTPASSSTGDSILHYNPSGNPALFMDRYAGVQSAASVAQNITIRRSSGTFQSPADLESDGWRIGTITGQAYNNGAFRSAAAIAFVTDGSSAAVSNVSPGAVKFFTSGSSSLINVAGMDSYGRWSYGQFFSSASALSNSYNKNSNLTIHLVADNQVPHAFTVTDNGLTTRYFRISGLQTYGGAGAGATTIGYAVGVGTGTGYFDDATLSILSTNTVSATDKLLSVRNYAMNTVLVAQNSGNVGIGNAAPATSLDVTGTSQFGTTAKSTVTTTGQIQVSNGVSGGTASLIGGISIASVTLCGNTVVVNGSATAGKVTAGTVAAATCVITWTPPFANGSVVFWENQSRVLSITTTASGVKSSTVTFSGNWTAGDTLSYSVTGY